MSPQEMFDKLAQAIGDNTFFHLVSTAKQAKTREEKLRAQDLAKKRINSVLLHELENHFNAMPEVQREPNESLIPEKKKFIWVRIFSKQDSLKLRLLAKYLVQ